MVIEPGEQFRIGTIVVSGTERVADYIVLRELETQQGDLFSTSTLLEDHRRLYDMDLFRDITIEPDWQLAEGRLVPLVVNLEEKPPRGIKIGAGYGTEEKFRALGQIRWRNFLGRGYIVRLTGKYSDLGYLIDTSFENPYLLGKKGLVLDYTVGFERKDEESFRNDQYFSRIRVNKGFANPFSFLVGHNLESNNTESSGAVSASSLSKYGRLEEHNFLISSLETGIDYDSVDDPINSGTGMSLSYTLETAAKFFGSEFEFLCQHAEWRCYYSPLREIVLAIRTTLGTVDLGTSDDYIPILKRFFSGGSNSVRGYPYQDLGDKDAQGNPIGGFSLLEASAECCFPLVWRLNGVLFIDGGNVFIDPYQFEAADLR